MKNNTKDIITIHIINSVKGGCGKTAFSLFKALELAGKEKDNSLGADMEEASVIWIDADFTGTASRVLFYGKDESSFQTINGLSIEKLKKEDPELFVKPSLKDKNQLSFGEKYIRYTVNDYLEEKIHEYEKMIIHGYAFYAEKSTDENAEGKKFSYGINGAIDFIFSSPDMENKRLFNYGEGLPTVEIGRFTYLMKVLMTNLIEIGRTGTKASEQSNRISGYKHIVIDMPPGDDAYSGALLYMLRQLAEDRTDEKDCRIEICLYTLATSDRGHHYALLESLKDILQKRENYKHKETVYAVLGEIRNGEFDKSTLEKYINQIDEIDKEEKEEEKVRIILCEYQQFYYENCRSMDGLKMKPFAYKLTKLDRNKKKNEVN
jgi:hypothetical protein